MHVRGLGGEHGRAHDAGLVLQHCRDAAHARGEVVDELLGVLADAAADDHEIGPEQRVDGVDVFRQALAPGVPAEALALLDRGRRAPLGVLAAHLQVPEELGVRQQHAVVEERRPDPGSDVSISTVPFSPRPAPKRISARAGGVGVVPEFADAGRVRRVAKNVGLVPNCKEG